MVGLPTMDRLAGDKRLPNGYPVFAEQIKRAGNFLQALDYFGSPNWTRTSDPLINSQLLYQLSYRGIEQVHYYTGRCYSGQDGCAGASNSRRREACWAGGGVRPWRTALDARQPHRQAAM